VQVTRATFIPLLAPVNADRIDPAAVRDEFTGDLTVVYTFGPQFGRRVVTHVDLEQLAMPADALRRSAYEHLEVLAGRAEFHGQPPALMLSFEGLESSLLLATDFWSRLQGAVPGELVVGVPARDVVVVTGSHSQAGLEKARRCVERVFFAGDEHLLTRRLLVRRGNNWEPFDRPAGPRQAPRAHGAMRHRGPDQMPRQYQEHPSWPEARVPHPVSGGPGQRFPGVPVGPVPHGPVPVGPVSAGPMGRPAHHGAPVPPAGPHRPAPMTATSTGGMPPVGMTSTGAMRPVGMTHTGAMPPVGMTSTGATPPVPSPREPYPTGPADIAQYSAVPYSAVPYSAVPYSAVPYSAVPYSAAPYAVAPQSLAPNSALGESPYLQSRGARGPQPHQPAPKPRYRDDAYSTGARPLYSYEQAERPSYRDDRYEEPRGDSQPSYAYPESWGAAPRPTRPEYTTGPRARFTR
jgi:hypothetical protein